MELIVSEITDTKSPYFMNLKNEIGQPADCDVSATITFAAAPIMVALR